MRNWLNRSSRKQAVYWWKTGFAEVAQGLLNIWRGIVRCLPYWWKLHRLLEPGCYRDEIQEATQ